MEELEKKVVELIKEGYSLRKISKGLEKDYFLILDIKDKLMQTGKITLLDIEEGKEYAKRKRMQEDEIVQKILEYKRQGISDNEISKKSDINKVQTVVSTYVRECIRLGLITKEDIEKAKKKRKEKDKNDNPDRIRILEGLKRGELDTVIAKDTTVGYQQVKNIRLELIEEGLITQEEIDSAREKNMQEQNSKELLDVVSLDKEKLMSYLILGYDAFDIKRKHGNIDINEYQKLIDELVKEERITKEEIIEYRERKSIEDMEKVLKYLKQGLSQRTIVELIDSTLAKVQTYIEKIKIEQNITNEDIKLWKSQQEDSLDNKKIAVLYGLRKGLTRSEIIKEYPKQKLTESDIKNFRRLLVEEGSITEPQITEYREQRKNEDKVKLSKFQKTVLDYLKQGYTLKEISDLIHKSYPYVYNSMGKIIEKGRITKQEIEQYREEKRSREERKKVLQTYNSLRREIDIDVRFSRNVTNQKKEKIREYVEVCYRLYRYEEIPVSELDFLGKCIDKIEIGYRDITNFIKVSINIKLYDKALNMIKSVNRLKPEEITEQRRETLSELEINLKNALKVQKAIQIMKRGNVNTEVLSATTGLSKDQINILKIKLLKKEVKFLDVCKREKIISLLLQEKNVESIYRKLDMSDFEIQDIEEQAKYRRMKSRKVDSELEIKQDSRIRIVVLYTKLGTTQQDIADIFQIAVEEINQDIQKALNVGMIKENELQGIKLLDDKKFEQFQL